jgi:hypothetical protein
MPWLDQYFVYMSSLGTHTFFMTGLPATYFFGYDQFGHGYVNFALLAHVNKSSCRQAFTGSSTRSLHFVIRKRHCLRPKTVHSPCHPPQCVHNYSMRVSNPNFSLAFSNHHLEYEFPSTHSTNSISIALFIYTHVHQLTTLLVPSTNLIPTLSPLNNWTISPNTYWISTLLLVWYMFSIVHGWLYTTMHSFTDCAMGVQYSGLYTGSLRTQWRIGSSTLDGVVSLSLICHGN